MKFIKFIIITAALTLLSATAHAEENSVGDYIVRMDTSGVQLMSLPEDMQPISVTEGLYTTDRETAERLLANGTATHIEPNVKVELFDTSPVPNDPYYSDSQDYLNKFGFETMYDLGITGEGVRVAFIDSGADISHEDLSHANASGFRIVEKENGQILTADGLFYNDEVGHGTKTFGISAAERDNGIGISGIIPDAEFVVANAFPSSNIYVSYIIAAAYFLADMDVDVVNMSFGVSYSLAPSLADTDSEFYKALKHLHDSGAILVAAAGNYSTSDICYPAGYDFVIGCGSNTVDGGHSSFSQYNESVFATMCGNVYSTTAGGGYASDIGTSLSAPQLTSLIAAALSEKPELTEKDILEIIRTSAVDAGAEGRDDYFGYGIVRYDLFAENLLAYNSYSPPDIRADISQTDSGGSVINVHLSDSDYYRSLYENGTDIYISLYSADGQLISFSMTDGTDISIPYSGSTHNIKLKCLMWQKDTMIPVNNGRSINIIE